MRGQFVTVLDKMGQNSELREPLTIKKPDVAVLEHIKAQESKDHTPLTMYAKAANFKLLPLLRPSKNLSISIQDDNDNSPSDSISIDSQESDKKDSKELDPNDNNFNPIFIIHQYTNDGFQVTYRTLDQEWMANSQDWLHLEPEDVSYKRLHKYLLSGSKTNPYLHLDVSTCNAAFPGQLDIHTMKAIMLDRDTIYHFRPSYTLRRGLRITPRILDESPHKQEDDTCKELYRLVDLLATSIPTPGITYAYCRYLSLDDQQYYDLIEIHHGINNMNDVYYNIEEIKNGKLTQNKINFIKNYNEWSQDYTELAVIFKNKHAFSERFPTLSYEEVHENNNNNKYQNRKRDNNKRHNTNNNKNMNNKNKIYIKPQHSGKHQYYNNNNNNNRQNQINNNPHFHPNTPNKYTKPHNMQPQTKNRPKFNYQQKTDYQNNNNQNYHPDFYLKDINYNNNNNNNNFNNSNYNSNYSRNNSNHNQKRRSNTKYPPYKKTQCRDQDHTQRSRRRRDDDSDDDNDNNNNNFSNNNRDTRDKRDLTNFHRQKNSRQQSSNSNRHRNNRGRNRHRRYHNDSSDRTNSNDNKKSNSSKSKSNTHKSASDRDSNRSNSVKRTFSVMSSEFIPNNQLISANNKENKSNNINRSTIGPNKKRRLNNTKDNKTKNMNQIKKRPKKKTDHKFSLQHRPKLEDSKFTYDNNLNPTPHTSGPSTWLKIESQQKCILPWWDDTLDKCENIPNLARKVLNSLKNVLILPEDSEFSVLYFRYNSDKDKWEEISAKQQRKHKQIFYVVASYRALIDTLLSAYLTMIEPKNDPHHKLNNSFFNFLFDKNIRQLNRNDRKRRKCNDCNLYLNHHCSVSNVCLIKQYITTVYTTQRFLLQHPWACNYRIKMFAKTSYNLIIPNLPLIEPKNMNNDIKHNINMEIRPRTYKQTHTNNNSTRPILPDITINDLKNITNSYNKHIKKFPEVIQRRLPPVKPVVFNRFLFKPPQLPKETNYNIRPTFKNEDLLSRLHYNNNSKFTSNKYGYRTSRPIISEKYFSSLLDTYESGDAELTYPQINSEQPRPITAIDANYLIKDEYHSTKEKPRYRLHEWRKSLARYGHKEYHVKPNPEQPATWRTARSHEAMSTRTLSLLTSAFNNTFHLLLEYEKFYITNITRTSHPLFFYPRLQNLQNQRLNNKITYLSTALHHTMQDLVGHSIKWQLPISKPDGYKLQDNIIIEAKYIIPNLFQTIIISVMLEAILQIRKIQNYQIWYTNSYTPLIESLEALKLLIFTKGYTSCQACYYLEVILRLDDLARQTRNDYQRFSLVRGMYNFIYKVTIEEYQFIHNWLTWRNEIIPGSFTPDITHALDDSAITMLEDATDYVRVLIDYVNFDRPKDLDQVLTFQQQLLLFTEDIRKIYSGTKEFRDPWKYKINIPEMLAKIVWVLENAYSLTSSTPMEIQGQQYFPLNIYNENYRGRVDNRTALYNKLMRLTYFITGTIYDIQQPDLTFKQSLRFTSKSNQQSMLSYAIDLYALRLIDDIKELTNQLQIPSKYQQKIKWPLEYDSEEPFQYLSLEVEDLGEPYIVALHNIYTFLEVCHITSKTIYRNNIKEIQGFRYDIILRILQYYGELLYERLNTWKRPERYISSRSSFIELIRHIMRLIYNAISGSHINTMARIWNRSFTNADIFTESMAFTNSTYLIYYAAKTAQIKLPTDVADIIIRYTIECDKPPIMQACYESDKKKRHRLLKAILTPIEVEQFEGLRNKRCPTCERTHPRSRREELVKHMTNTCKFIDTYHNILTPFRPLTEHWIYTRDLRAFDQQTNISDNKKTAPTPLETSIKKIARRLNINPKLVQQIERIIRDLVLIYRHLEQIATIRCYLHIIKYLNVFIDQISDELKCQRGHITIDSNGISKTQITNIRNRVQLILRETWFIPNHSHPTNYRLFANQTVDKLRYLGERTYQTRSNTYIKPISFTIICSTNMMGDTKRARLHKIKDSRFVNLYLSYVDEFDPSCQETMIDPRELHVRFDADDKKYTYDNVTSLLLANNEIPSGQTIYIYHYDFINKFKIATWFSFDLYNDNYQTNCFFKDIWEHMTTNEINNKNLRVTSVRWEYKIIPHKTQPTNINIMIPEESPEAEEKTTDIDDDGDIGMIDMEEYENIVSSKYQQIKNLEDFHFYKNKPEKICYYVICEVDCRSYQAYWEQFNIRLDEVSQYLIIKEITNYKTTGTQHIYVIVQNPLKTRNTNSSTLPIPHYTNQVMDPQESKGVQVSTCNRCYYQHQYCAGRQFYDLPRRRSAKILYIDTQPKPKPKPKPKPEPKPKTTVERETITISDDDEDEDARQTNLNFGTSLDSDDNEPFYDRSNNRLSHQTSPLGADDA